MPDITLLNKSGEAVAYSGVDTLEVDTPDGGTTVFYSSDAIPDTYVHPSTHPASMITDLAPVATNGAFDSLLKKPCFDLPRLDEATLTFAQYTDGIECYACDLPGTWDSIKGESYKITWDGVEYTCVCKDATDIEDISINDWCYFGNFTLLLNAGLGEDTGEPFLIGFNADYDDVDAVGKCTIMTNDSSSTHTVSIIPVNTTRQLDAKYLPDEVATKEYVQEEIAKIDVSGGGSSIVTETDILPEQELSFGLVSALDIYCWSTASEPEKYPDPILFTLTEGETYIVEWDDARYTCTAFAGSFGTTTGIGLGNIGLVGGEDTGEPFVFGVTDDGSGTACYTLDTAESHTVRICQQADVTVSWDNITDKPFYTEEACIEWLAKSDLSFTPESENGFYVTTFTPTSDMLSLWSDENFNTVEVVWDGTIYRCEKQLFQGFNVAGDIDLMMGTGSNGLPFVIMAADAATFGQDIGMIYSVTEFGDDDISDDPVITHSVGISFVTENVKKLDNKFLSIVNYTPASETIILPEQTVEGFAEEDSDGRYSAVLNGSFTTLTVNEQYTIIWDGVEYICTAIDFGGIGGVGNVAIMGGSSGNGEPFAIGVVPASMNGTTGYDSLIIYTTETDTSHVVHIFQSTEEVCTIKDECLSGNKVLPPITANDNGKVLRVVGGSPVWWDVDQLSRPVYATLNDYSWEEIASISADGLGDTFFDVGDCKAVELSGTVGTLSVDGTYYVYILGFDHNGATNTIDFGGFKTAAENGVDIGLIDSAYNSGYSNGSLYFNINHWGYYNYGGWKGCDMRYDILGSTDVAPSDYGAVVTTSRVGYDASDSCATTPVQNTLMAALPSDLRAQMKPMTIYTDNVGAATNTVDCITTSVDYLPLLAEAEVCGMWMCANEYEYNYQTQYEYFANGNSKVKYAHNDTTSAVHWWVRSPYCDDSGSFCGVNSGGGADARNAHASLGLAPAFRI